MLKFFPAEAAGGLAWLKAVGAPLADLRFCPTGGIGADTAQAYLALHNVACVGGSWVAPASAVDAKDWSQVERLAAAASKYKRS
jgi:2-dehydro-3-deoxyphosphogluconate aldolase/(4S)-4-hydroxy-2-oxoglutarate aldolase